MLFLNNTVSSDGCKMFMMLTASIIILVLPMKNLEMGAVLAFSEIQW